MAADPAWYLSGGAANANPNASLGGVISSNPSGANLFDNVTGDESASGDIEYRGVYVKNDGDVSLQNAKVWIQVNTPSADDTVAIALADEGSNATMETIAAEDTAPVGPVFSSPADKASGLDIGTLAAGQRYGVWIRRTVSAGANAFNNDGFTLRAEGDSSE